MGSNPIVSANCSCRVLKIMEGTVQWWTTGLENRRVVEIRLGRSAAAVRLLYPPPIREVV